MLMCKPYPDAIIYVTDAGMLNAAEQHAVRCARQYYHTDVVPFQSTRNSHILTGMRTVIIVLPTATFVTIKYARFRVCVFVCW